MMWHLFRIPRVAHFYWGHDYMPWVRWLTLKTFRHHNPDWRMTLWVPPTPVHVEGPRAERDAYGRDDLPTGMLTPDYLDRVEELGIDIAPVDVERLAGVSLAQDIPSVHVREQVKGDYLRLWILSHLGGVSLDMDLLFFRSMERALFNNEENSNAEAIVCRYPFDLGIYYWGFMYSAKHGPLFTQMWEAAKRVPTSEFRGGHNFYRVAGHLAKELWPTDRPLPLGMLNMPFQTFMTHTDRFDLEHPFPDVSERIGIHWHGSSSYGTFVKATPETWRDVLPQCLMRESIDRSLKGLA